MLPLTTTTNCPSPPAGDGAVIFAPGVMVSDLTKSPWSSLMSGTSSMHAPDVAGGNGAFVVICHGLREAALSLGSAPGKRWAPGSNRERNVMKVHPVFSFACSGPYGVNARAK